MTGGDSDGDLFLESLDRLSASSSAGDSDDDLNYATATSTIASSDYAIWISEPSSVEERRNRLLSRMGLATCTPEFARSSLSFSGGEVSCSGSNDCCSVVRSRSYGGGADLDNSNIVINNNSNDIGFVNQFSSDSCDDSNNNVSNLSVCFPEKIIPVNSFSNPSGALFVNSPSVPGNNDVSPSKPPTGKNGRRTGADEIRYENDLCIISGSNLELEEECLSVCTIKNLDTGKEFVVNEVREDGSWEKVKEVGTGRQLTMEEFETFVGHSPIVQELMRRQNVEDGNKDCSENSANGGSGNGLKMKKKGSWLKSIKNVASTMAGSRERRSSDERDTSSEKGGQRSSSATDDSQDVSFHGPERVKVRQYGKPWKEVSALYKSQEIKGHNGSIWSIKFSLDGKYLASAGEDCVIHVWQVGETERKGDLLMDKAEDGNFSLSFLVNGSPEVNLLSPKGEGHLEKKRRGRSSISRKSVSVEPVLVPETVFALSEKPFCSFRGHLDDVLDLSWSKSQHLLSSSMDKTVRLWHLSSNSCLKIFSHSDYVTCIQFNPVDDKHFISGSLDGKVRIWSIPDRQVVDWNDLHEMVTAACYTPDGQGALVGSYKGSCRVYNTSENKLQQKGHINLQNKKKKSHQKKITGFQFAPGSSSEVHITSADSRIRVIDDVDLVHKFKGFRNTNSQISASLTANGKFVVCASEDSHVYIWRHDSDSRPNRSKGITVTRSYEHFHCQDVSVAIPWPGMTNSYVDDVSTINHPSTPVEEMNLSSVSSNSPLHGTISSASNNYFFDRISATWPEEKLVLATKLKSPRVSVDFTNEISQSRSAWGMVIVTAGLRGEIRTFQNFGMPVRI